MMQSVVVEHGLRRAIVSVAVIAATLLEIIDTTIVNVALPNIQGKFRHRDRLERVDRDRLHHRERGRHSDHPVAGVTLRPPAVFLLVDRSVHVCVADVRLLRQLRPTRVLADHTRSGRRRPDRNLASDSPRHVYPARTRDGARHLRDGRDRRTGARAGHGRLDHRQLQLALDLFHQLTGRDCGRDPDLELLA